MTADVPAVDVVLDNGLRLLVVADNRIPVVAVCVWYRVGARDEPPRRTGLAHLFEHMMFQGSPNLAPNEHIEYVQDRGGSINGDTTLEGTYFIQTLPAEYLAPVLWMEADRMWGIATTVNDDRLATQRSVVIHERRQRYDSRPKALEWERMMALAHPEGHPFQHLPAGRVSDLHAISLADAIRFARTFYAPDNAVISVVGDVDPAQVTRHVERYFGQIPAAGQPARPTSPASTLMSSPVFTRPRIDHRRRVLITYRLPAQRSAGSAAASAMMSILSSGRRGRLGRLLAEQEDTFADVTVQYFELALAPSLAMLEIVCDETVAVPDLLAAVNRAFGSLGTAGPDPDDLTTARRLLQRKYLERTATVDGRAIELARSTTLLGKPMGGAHFHAKVRAIDAGAIQAVAQRYLLPSNRTVVVLADPRVPDGR